MENKLNLDEIEKLPAKERALLKKRHALHCKYEKAVTLYADTTLSTRIIALRCGVTPGALGNYLLTPILAGTGSATASDTSGK